jgi:polyhydroxybutyrate depolymerase
MRAGSYEELIKMNYCNPTLKAALMGIGCAATFLACTPDPKNAVPSGGDAGDTGQDVGLPDVDLSANRGDAGSVDATMQSRDMGSLDVAAEMTDVVTTPLGGDRPAPVFLPASYADDEEWPLVVLLHGFSASGTVQDVYLGISARVDELGFVLVVPDGTENSQGNRFWNATDACCDFEGTGVDDESYLKGLIGEAKERYSIDAGRVYFIGHSNGGFMSYRMACHVSDMVTGIASLAGAMYGDSGQCEPDNEVSILQIHGTEDPTIPYAGTALYPSARGGAEFWASKNGCSSDSTVKASIDLVGNTDTETVVESWTPCRGDVQVELWKIEGAGHIPGFRPGVFSERVLGFLMASDRTP